MTGPDLHAIREHLGLTAEVFGRRVLGMDHKTRNSVQASMGKLEAMQTVPDKVARIAYLVSLHGVPPKWMDTHPASPSTSV